MNGKPAVAPCGHTGETIIGNFVLCRPCSTGTAPARAGVVGHINTCICLGCKVRKFSTKIVLREKSGKDYVSVNWNSSADMVNVDTKGFGEITNYRFLGENDEIIAQGTCHGLIVDTGMTLTLPIDELIEAASLSTIYKGIKAKSKSSLAHYVALSFGAATPAPARNSFAGMPTIPVPAVPAPLSGAITKTYIKQYLESGAILDLIEVDVDDSLTGIVDVSMIRVSTYANRHSQWHQYHGLIRNDIRRWLNIVAPLTSTVVFNRTPMYCLDLAVKDCAKEVKLGTTKVADVFDFVVNRMANGRFAPAALIRPTLTHRVLSSGTHAFDLTWHNEKFSCSFMP